MVFDNLSKYGDRIALIDEFGRSVSYSQLITEGDILIKNINQRCIVFLLCRNCLESVVAYISFLRNGIVPVLLSDTINQLLLRDLIDSYHPSYCFLPAENSKEVNGIPVYTYGNYTLLKFSFEIDYKINSDLALLLPTSGSTGSPKLVRQTYKNLKANTESIITYLGITNVDRAITSLPLNYTYGMSILNTHLYAGAILILVNSSLLEQRFWDTVKREKVTTFGGVPYTFEMLKKLQFERLDLPSLKYITQAGGKLPKELADKFIAICKKKNIKFFIMYGQTEASPRMSYLPWEYAETKSGSIGIAIPGGQFWLEDDYGVHIKKPWIAGELIYQGENVTLGYAENRYDLNNGDDNNGILHTGDMAQCDEDGFYYIVGRRKRFLKLFGNRINLDELEELLRKKNIDCACTGIDDLLKIYVITKKDAEKAIEFIRKHTAINQNGFKVYVIDALPRNDAGKILYSALQ
jgi:acyl-CoA synthetase (AMP-forming)/AMP-acid ligase II